MKRMFVGCVPTLNSHELTGGFTSGTGVRLKFRDATGNVACVHADHVIAATGYRVDIRRLDYLDE
jgi:hypothetical protein